MLDCVRPRCVRVLPCSHPAASATSTSQVCQIAKLEPKELDQEHRNLLAVAFKNVVGARRHSWRELALDYKQRAASHDHVGAEV